MSDKKHSNSKLNVSLSGLNVCLSGAIPERECWSEPAMDRGILEFVALFSGLIFKYGGRIIHGSHPSFTPVILRQARLHAISNNRPPVTLVMSDLWFSDYSDEEIEKMTDIAELIVTKKIGEGDASNPDVRNASLTAMRKVLVASQNMMVSVGGKLHDKDGSNPGVAEEMMLASSKKIPRYLIGGLGGYSQKMAKSFTPTSLFNDLPFDKNVELFGTNDVSSCVNIIFKSLCERFWKYNTLDLPSPCIDEVGDLIKNVLRRK